MRVMNHDFQPLAGTMIEQVKKCRFWEAAYGFDIANGLYMMSDQNSFLNYQPDQSCVFLLLRLLLTLMMRMLVSSENKRSVCSILAVDVEY